MKKTKEDIMEQFISEHGGVSVSGIVTIALLGIIMAVICILLEIWTRDFKK